MSNSSRAHLCFCLGRGGTTCKIMLGRVCALLVAMKLLRAVVYSRFAGADVSTQQRRTRTRTRTPDTRCSHGYEVNALDSACKPDPTPVLPLPALAANHCMGSVQDAGVECIPRASLHARPTCKTESLISGTAESPLRHSLIRLAAQIPWPRSTLAPCSGRHPSDTASSWLRCLVLATASLWTLYKHTCCTSTPDVSTLEALVAFEWLVFDTVHHGHRATVC